MKKDEDYLKLLSIFHYVVAGLAGMFALFPIIHLVLGIFFILAPQKTEGKGEEVPVIIGWIFVLIAAAIMTVGWLFAAFIFTAGRFLAKRKHYDFCLVMAGVECMFMPFGTVLGVLTIILLMRETVKSLFATPGSAPPTP